MGVFAAPFATQRDVLLTTVSFMSLWQPELEMGPETQVGGGPFEASAQFFPLSTTRWRSFVAFRQPESEGVSPSVVSAAIRFHEPDVV
jgi:hypothetical protein